MLVHTAPPEHCDWIARRANVVIGPSFRAIEAVDSAGRIHGMVGYDGWCPGSVSMHVAIDNPACVRSLIRPAFAIPFLELKIPIVKAFVLSDNERSLSLLGHLGFRELARLGDWWAPGVDVVLLEMRRHDCRWLEFERKAA